MHLLAWKNRFVEVTFPRGTINQKLDSNTSVISMEFLCSLLRRYFTGKPVEVWRNVSCFHRLYTDEPVKLRGIIFTTRPEFLFCSVWNENGKGRTTISTMYLMQCWHFSRLRLERDGLRKSQLKCSYPWLSSCQHSSLSDRKDLYVLKFSSFPLRNHPGGGGATAIYGLYRYVPL